MKPAKFQQFHGQRSSPSKDTKEHSIGMTQSDTVLIYYTLDRRNDNDNCLVLSQWWTGKLVNYMLQAVFPEGYQILVKILWKFYSTGKMLFKGLRISQKMSSGSTGTVLFITSITHESKYKACFHPPTSSESHTLNAIMSPFLGGPSSGG